jgi:hypothetical protein
MVMPPIRKTKENRNGSSPNSENTIAHQDVIPRSNIPHLALFNSRSNFFSITTLPLQFNNIFLKALTFLGEYQ